MLFQKRARRYKLFCSAIPLDQAQKILNLFNTMFEIINNVMDFSISLQIICRLCFMLNSEKSVALLYWRPSPDTSWRKCE
jgi:hypothetical protein